jgi:WD40 repeat protein
VWNTATGEVLDRFQTGATTRAVAISPDGRRVVVGDRVIDRETGNEMGTIDTRFHAVFSGDGTRIGSDVGTTAIGLWDAEAMVDVESFDWAPRTASFTQVLSIDVSFDGEQVAGAGRNSVFVLQADGRTSRFHAEETVTHVALHPDGQSVLAIAGDDQVLSWRLDDPETVTRLGPESANTLAISPDGTLLVAQLADGEWRLVDAETGADVQRLPWPTMGRIDSRALGQVGYTPAIARFGADGNQIATASGDGMVQLWCRGESI